MAKLFKRILVPIDFTEGSDIAIKKAVQLADPLQSAICLLYICKPLFSLNIFSTTGYIIAPATEILTISEIEQKIAGYKSYLQDHLDSVIVETVISKSRKVQSAIEETSELFGSDLIVIYKRGIKSIFQFHHPVSPDQMAKNTDCPVLTIKEGAGERKIRNIVVPVMYRMPERKLEIAIKLAKIFGANIHLISFPDNQDDGGRTDRAFIESFKKIRENASLIIKHGPLYGNDIARAVLKYSESIQADMILVNPVTESSIHYMIGKLHISDLLSEHSPIQVLDIQPYIQAN